MKTIVLDDDPTGTQSATGVPVLLDSGGDRLHEALRLDDSVYVQTNSRAISEARAVRLVAEIREAGCRAADRLGDNVRFVLRGDSTLRGHVFAESDVLATQDSVLLFLPAFPAGGRTTRGGVHYVRVGTEDVPAASTEYAEDPVFGFRAGSLPEYVGEKGNGRRAITVTLEQVRTSGGTAVTDALLDAPSGTVVIPDAVTDEDVALVHAGLEAAWVHRDVVVRCAAPLAARCAGVHSTGLLPVPLDRPAGSILLVCGSHTSGATAQLTQLEKRHGYRVLTLPTEHALADPVGAGQALAVRASADLEKRGVAVIASERRRLEGHDTLDHGQRVMTAITTAVQVLAGTVRTVVTKGGITSADVVRVGFGARTARVRGQVLDGVSVWDLVTADGTVTCVVVPGNVGDDLALARVLDDLTKDVR